MSILKITVEETTVDQNGETYTRKMVTETDNYTETVEDVTELFRSILYWLTFSTGTIDQVIADRESIEIQREEEFQRILRSKNENVLRK